MISFLLSLWRRLKVSLCHPSIKPGQVWQYGTKATNIPRDPFKKPYTCFPFTRTVIEVKGEYVQYDDKGSWLGSVHQSSFLRETFGLYLISSPHAEDADWVKAANRALKDQS